MLGKRLVAALVILAFLVACVSDPSRDDAGQAPQAVPQAAGSTSASPDGKAVDGGGGGGNFNIPSNGDALLVIAGIIVMLVAAEAVIWTVDYIKNHSNPSLTGTVKDGIYYAKDGSFSVAVPGRYPAQGESGFTIHEIKDQGQERVVFLPAKDGDPLYGISVQPPLSPADAAMSPDDYASKLYPAPAQDGKRLSPVLEEKLQLGGKPALFREYIQRPSIGAEPVYYLLYFLKSGDRSALISITWTNDCPKCVTGPEADIRATDPAIGRFVDSFRLASTEAR